MKNPLKKLYYYIMHDYYHIKWGCINKARQKNEIQYQKLVNKENDYNDKLVEINIIIGKLK